LVPPVRQLIVSTHSCGALAFLGVHIDPALNASGASLLSPHGSDVRVHVIRTDEEAMIAAAVMDVLDERALSRGPLSEAAPRR
jgi:acetate kinase